jgi:hypothetical protein
VKIGQSFASMMWPRLQIIEGKQEGIQWSHLLLDFLDPIVLFLLWKSRCIMSIGTNKIYDINILRGDSLNALGAFKKGIDRTRGWYLLQCAFTALILFFYTVHMFNVGFADQGEA